MSEECKCRDPRNAHVSTCPLRGLAVRRVALGMKLSTARAAVAACRAEASELAKLVPLANVVEGIHEAELGLEAAEGALT